MRVSRVLLIIEKEGNEAEKKRGQYQVLREFETRNLERELKLDVDPEKQAPVPSTGTLWLCA